MFRLQEVALRFGSTSLSFYKDKLQNKKHSTDGAINAAHTRENTSSILLDLTVLWWTSRNERL